MEGTVRTAVWRAALLASSALIAQAMPAAAQNATWLGNPGSGDFNSAANWSPATVPAGTAFFGVSNTTNLSLSANTIVGGWTFNAGASNYNINTNFRTLRFLGAGIEINGGSVTITNTAALQFHDTSTAGRATIINNGDTFFFGSSTAGNATITNNEAIEFRDTSTAGAATVTNRNNLTFFGSSTAGTALISNTGGVNFRNTSTAGSATITTNNSLIFFDASTAGSATITNTGDLRFRDTSSAGSASIENRLGLFFSGNSTAGSATITNRLLLQFSNSSTGGTARFINSAGGTIDLSTLGNAGMTAGSIEGAGTVKLGAKNLTLGSNNLSTTFSGVLEGGGGSLTKVGTGDLTLSGQNTYTGPTLVNAGILTVNGSIAGSVAVAPGAAIEGNGKVGSLTTAGTVNPGNSIGTLSVENNLTFDASSRYVVEFASTSDRINVTSTATLGGTLVLDFLPGSAFVQQYNVLHADGGIGNTTFSNVIAPANFSVEVTYQPNDVLVDLTPSLGLGTSLAGNASVVANVINNFYLANATLPPAVAGLYDLTGSGLAQALAQTSGEAASGAQYGAFQLGSQFLGLMLDPFVNGRGGAAGGAALGFAPEHQALPDDVALAYAKLTKAQVYKASPVAFEPRWTVWGGAYGGYNRTDGEPAAIGSHDLSARTAGFAVGADYRVAPGSVVGFALAGGSTKWDLTQGLGGGKSDAFQAGVYAVTRSGPWHFAGALAFTNHWMSTDRFAPFGNQLTADFDAQSFGGRLEGGYRVGTPIGGATPYAALQAQGFRTPSYRETDLTGGGFALNYESRTASAIRSELGARFDYVAAVLDRGAVLTLRGRLAWAHDWVSDPSLAAVFQALPGASFIVNGALPAKDLALASAGAELRLATGVTLLAKFDGEFASNAQTYAGTGTIRWAW